ncbi:MAG: MFS transporter [Anaerolinea sp.]|nr:MFS transporter [Anaerolinea sp.]
MRWQQIGALLVFVTLASLDNAAAGVLPPLYAIIARDLNTNDAALGMVTAVYVLIVAIAAIGWGYRGDRGQRKHILLWGTLIWGCGMVASGLATTFWRLLLWQGVTAVGVGSISSVGFSVISDLIPVHRRGLALSLWSLAQTLGGAFGALLASTVGAANWRWPFFIIATLGFLFALLYLFTPEPARGQAEPELAPLFARGQRYAARIEWVHLRHLLAQGSNRLLLLQSFFMALAYGSTIWIPRWAIARVEAEGFGLETATVVGNLFVTLFGLGLFFSIPAGHLGDRWQQRRADGRVYLAMIGLLGAIPFFILLYFIPLHGIAIPANAAIWDMAWAVLSSLFRNGWVALGFLVAVIGLALYSFDQPNWAATITAVNLPEHRGTIIGISRLARALGSAFSVGLAGALFTKLGGTAVPPLNYAIGLALFQAFVIPAIICYGFARKTVPADVEQVRQTLRRYVGTAV